MDKKYSREIKIGLVTLGALIITYFGINFLKGINIFSPKNTYYTNFVSVNNVSIATPVTVGGFKVGSVKDMDFNYKAGKGAQLEIRFDKKIKIPVGSALKIKQNALSGAEIILYMGDTAKGYLEPGSTIPSLESGGDIFSLTYEKILPMVDKLMPKIDSVLTGVNQKVNNPNIDSTLRVLYQTSLDVKDVAMALKSSTSNLPEIMNKIERSTANAEVFTKDLRQVNLQEIINNLNEASASIKTTTQKFNSKDNTAGLLFNDPALYNRIDSLARSAEMLMRDIRENPKRYVHFSVF
ncbi:MlaD family protein [Porphyromonas pogonae]|uniref:MlaD family protein n=1 Tax=Porphyromonas pogonae TaxID=867595 RepID=UPI002E768ACF|nr:MlaD family protein [Porphyromonas pogonae]